MYVPTMTRSQILRAKKKKGMTQYPSPCGVRSIPPATVESFRSWRQLMTHRARAVPHLGMYLPMYLPWQCCLILLSNGRQYQFMTHGKVRFVSHLRQLFPHPHNYSGQRDSTIFDSSALTAITELLGCRFLGGQSSQSWDISSYLRTLEYLHGNL